MAAALFGIRAGVAWQHVPYRGGGQLINAFLAGDVDVMSGDLSTVLPHAREGRAVLLGVTAPERSGAAPEVPSITEAVPGTGITIWFALFRATRHAARGGGPSGDGDAAAPHRLPRGRAHGRRRRALAALGPGRAGGAAAARVADLAAVVAEAGIRPE
jgi:hypothetical protein